MNKYDEWALKINDYILTNYDVAGKCSIVLDYEGNSQVEVKLQDKKSRIDFAYMGSQQFDKDREYIKSDWWGVNEGDGHPHRADEWMAFVDDRMARFGYKKKANANG